MVVIRPGDHVWLTHQGDKKLEVAIGVQIRKEPINPSPLMINLILRIKLNFQKKTQVRHPLWDKYSSLTALDK